MIRASGLANTRAANVSAADCRGTRTVMPAKARNANAPPTEPGSVGVEPCIADLILVRIASEGGATRNMVTRDLAPYTANKLSPAEWRQTVDQALAALTTSNLVTEKRGRLTATQPGSKRTAAFFNHNADTSQPWQIQRDISLVARALGIEKLTAPKRKALATPDGLRTLIVQLKFRLSAKKCQTPAAMRAALAVVALERAFGKKIKSGLGEKTNLPAKASRLLAGQLLDPAREFSTDAQLIAHIAADTVDARQTSVEELRQALLSRLAVTLLDTATKTAPPTAVKKTKSTSPVRKPSDVTRQAANDTMPAPLPKTGDGHLDLPQFSRIVNATAASCAEGWPGNMKAFISRVWLAIRDGHPDWNLSEDTFKSMLVDAHRAGLVILAGADLKNKTDLEDFEKSQTKYKNAVWHFIRVEA